MPESQSPARNQRLIIEALSAEFLHLHSQWCSIIGAQRDETVYEQLDGPQDLAIVSVGERILRSAAIVEQTCGGITANLWDDPFEWTLPETLNGIASIIEYLNDVESTRKRAFNSILSDADLFRDIIMPSGEVQSLVGLLLQTLIRANQLLGEATLALRIGRRAC